MYKTLWNHIKKHTKNTSVASVFLPVLVIGWTVAGLLIGTLICPFLQNTTALVKATVILCTGGYAGLIPGFFGGIFYIYRIFAKPSYTAVDFLQVQHS